MPLPRLATCAARFSFGVFAGFVFWSFLRSCPLPIVVASLLEPIVERLGATMHVEDGADHSFAVLKRSGRTDEGVLTGTLDRTVAWMEEHA